MFFKLAAEEFGRQMENLDGTRGQEQGWPFPGLQASFLERRAALSLECPSQGATMNEFSTWMQGNWYALGNLLAQFAFLIAGVWFARKILKTIRATQEQFGALLKLSMSDGLSERTKLSETHRPTPYVMAEWPAVAETPALSLPEREPRSKRLAATLRGAVRWLQAPMASEGHLPWKKVLHWLQTPAGS